MEKYKVGERVQGYGVNSGALYTGTVIREFGSSPGSECCINIETANGKTTRGDRRAYIKNVQRSSEVAYVNNLVGPKPEPVAEPKFVTPFKSEGRNVVDANDRVVISIHLGGYLLREYRQELPMSEAYELARLFAETLTEKYATKVEDSKSPF